MNENSVKVHIVSTLESEQTLNANAPNDDQVGVDVAGAWLF